MPWNSISPVGNRSVRFNRTAMNQNTTYIEEIMGNNTVIGNAKDHYWNIGANEDGYHRKVSLKNTGALINPPPTFDGVIYVNNNGLTPDKTLKYNNTTQDWTLNVWENVIEGSFNTPNSSANFTITTLIPTDRFGKILIFLKSTPWLAMEGYFYSDATKVHGFSGRVDFESTGLAISPIQFDDNPGTNNALRANVPANPAATYNTYRNKAYQFLLFYRKAF